MSEELLTLKRIEQLIRTLILTTNPKALDTEEYQKVDKIK